MDAVAETGISRSSAAKELAAGVVAFAGATVISWRLHFPLPPVAFIYFVIIILTAVRRGFRDATIASVIAVVCLDFFFTPPIFSFSILDADDWLALGAFEFAGLIASRLSTQAQRQASIARQERNNMARLYELSSGILLLDRHEPPGPQIAGLMRRALNAEAVTLFDPAADRLDEVGENSAGLSVIVRRTWQTEANPSGIEQDDPATGTWCRILRLGTKATGVVALRGHGLNSLVVDAAASIAAVALERARSLERETRAEAARQSEQLRTAVLDALAHAFKTPLTAIRAASSGLLVTGTLGGREEELVTIIDDETAHLNSLATRLLQTARLEGTDVPVRREVRPVADLLEELISGFPEDFVTRRIQMRLSDDEMEVCGNGPLLLTALTQLLDNAIKYSDAGTPVTISAKDTGAETIFSVHNFGPAIQPGERERIFERFYRSPGTEHRASGTGLGLSITKKVAEAHGGRSWVVSNQAEGTTFFLALPHVRPPATL